MIETKPDNVDICESCGCQIVNAVWQHRGLFGMGTCRQTYCAECAFQIEYRARCVKPRPYRIPGLRPKPDGHAPDTYVTAFEAQKARHLKAAEGVDPCPGT